MHRFSRLESSVAHIIAVMITAGFFAIIFLVITGRVDVKDPTTNGLVSLVIGYAAGSLNTVLGRYFKPKDGSGDAPIMPEPLRETPQSTLGTTAQQGQDRRAD